MSTDFFTVEKLNQRRAGFFWGVVATICVYSAVNILFPAETYKEATREIDALIIEVEDLQQLAAHLVQRVNTECTLKEME